MQIIHSKPKLRPMTPRNHYLMCIASSFVCTDKDEKSGTHCFKALSVGSCDRGSKQVPIDDNIWTEVTCKTSAIVSLGASWRRLRMPTRSVKKQLIS